PRAVPGAQAARHQPPVLSVPCGAGLWPAGCRQGWPAAGAGRASSPRAGVGGNGRLIFLYPAGLLNYRRHRCDYAVLTATAEAMNQISMTHLILPRLA